MSMNQSIAQELGELQQENRRIRAKSARRRRELRRVNKRIEFLYQVLQIAAKDPRICAKCHSLFEPTVDPNQLTLGI